MKNVHALCALVAIASGLARAADNQQKPLTFTDFKVVKAYNWQTGVAPHDPLEKLFRATVKRLATERWAQEKSEEKKAQPSRKPARVKARTRSQK